MDNFSVRSLELLEQKLSRFTFDTTRVVADFDGTITSHNGKTSWSLFADSWLMPEEYVKRRQALKNEYYLYELNESLPDSVRSSKMLEWWIGHLMLFVEFGLDLSLLQNVVSREMRIRKGVEKMMEDLSVHTVPLLVLSSGLTESIITVLKENNLLFSNVYIASNCLKFNEAGMCTGLLGERIIHPLNKNIWDAPEEIRNTFASRPNVLLFGDSLDDIKMVEKEKRDATIAIGFCTSSRSHQRELFDEVFDIVVESDDSDDGVWERLLEIIAQNSK